MCLRPISGVIAKACSMVRVPTPEEEDAKRTHRERENLVQERLRIENRIEALLFTQGIRKRPSLRSWERDLAVLRTGDGREMPRHLRAELDRLRRRLVMTLELIREVEAERDEAAEAKPQDQACRKIAALCRIRGIGENFAAVLTREVFYRSFDNRRQIASYVGITPMPYQSGGMDRDRRISRAGNPRARTTMIQLAWLWLRYQPGSELAEWFRKRVGTLAGRTRRIAIVAMARKLLIALWRYVETGVVPAGAEIRAETRSRDRRPGIAAGSIADGETGSATVFVFGGLNAAAFQVGRVSPGLRLVHEAFWCGPMHWPDRM